MALLMGFVRAIEHWRPMINYMVRTKMQKRGTNRSKLIPRGRGGGSIWSFPALSCSAHVCQFGQHVQTLPASRAPSQDTRSCKCAFHKPPAAAFMFTMLYETYTAASRANQMRAS